jgi:hypothetical protein
MYILSKAQLQPKKVSIPNILHVNIVHDTAKQNCKLIDFFS